MTEFKSALKDLRNLILSLKNLQRFSNNPIDRLFSKQETTTSHSNSNKVKDNYSVALQSLSFKPGEPFNRIPEKIPESWKDVLVYRIRAISSAPSSPKKDVKQKTAYIDDMNSNLKEVSDFEKAIKDINDSIALYCKNTNNKAENYSTTKKLFSHSEERSDISEKTPEASSQVSSKSVIVHPTGKKITISRADLDSRTRSLVHALKVATSNMSKLMRAEELSQHILKYPESRSVAVKEKAIPCLLRILKENKDKAVQMQTKETLTLLGYVFPVKGQGICILSIDGGGTRGVITIEVLRKLEIMTQQPIWKSFDYICGVSTGAVLALMIGAEKLSLDECEEIYKKISFEIFQRSTIIGAGNLLWNHAFYDTNTWINVLRSNMGEKLMIETAADLDCPKISVVSAIVNQPRLQPFLFRNYNLPPRVHSHYNGKCHYKMWEAVRASAAAPGYFEECKLDDLVHQDGGVLTNNPSALAIHESKLLWPNDNLQCVISIGNGRYEPSANPLPITSSSIKEKFTKILASATDTEGVHTVLQDLLPPSVYFRFNPYLSEDFQLDENEPQKIEQLQHDAQMYIHKNEHKVQAAANQLNLKKTLPQKGLDWLRTKSDMIM